MFSHNDIVHKWHAHCAHAHTKQAISTYINSIQSNSIYFQIASVQEGTGKTH